ncbi:MAG TPA: aminoglycoside phosphotransferase family protein [Pirellulales bacterium]|jgi:aminoglycoside phosphotransferase (APT) family kinase protein|nr:aminoglycoside phosphotransferase family protein [Pirellulales bacterium]
MLWLDEQNAADYLRQRGWLTPDEGATVRPLAGGVSNQVLYVECPDRSGGDFVLKQARPQLRTAAPWFASIERIWREVEVLRICHDLTARRDSRLPPLVAHTPEVLFEDRDNYVFAMQAAPPGHRTWKQDLLAGHADPHVAEQCGRLLGCLHSMSWDDAQLAERIGDRTLFDQLRIEPYYRALARAHPDMAPRIQQLIDSVWQHPTALVHADFSPKNLLLYPGGMMLIDFETGHYGDPAFDLGFFLTHLLLKAVYHAPDQGPFLELVAGFIQAYELECTATMQLADCRPDADRLAQWQAMSLRGVHNLAGCMWARLDGTSKIEYLEDEGQREWVRDVCRQLLSSGQLAFQDVLKIFHDAPPPATAVARARQDQEL